MEIVNVEDQIIKATIKALLAKGYLLSVNDGEEVTVSRSYNADALFEAMKTTGQDFLYAHMADEGHLIYGWVRFIYGNLGTEVINDYTVNLEPVMAEISAMIDRYGGRGSYEMDMGTDRRIL